MTLKEKIGQLFIIGFHGSELSENDPIAGDLSAGNLGGVILFDKFLSGTKEDSNIVSFPQLSALCQKLREMASTKPFICIDQEGGMVSRLKEAYGFPATLSAEEMGRDPDFVLSRAQAETTSRLLAQAGINCDFAPVADLNINPDNPIIGKLGRSFSANPDTVAGNCEIWLEELQANGILGCLKHFPGHGSSSLDSHKDFVDISSTWEDAELLPYKVLIEKQKVPAIMIGHLFHRKLDNSLPASLSANIINTLLREKLQFNGLVVTDDLQMKAITDRYGLLEAITLALNGGTDLVIIGNNLDYDRDIFKKAVDHVEQAVIQGTISGETINTAWKRVQRCKQTLG